MSVHVISWVLRHSPATGSRRLVLIVLADHANADGTRSYPSLETIRQEARLGSRTTVKDSLRDLRAAGLIRRTGTAEQGQAIYQVMMGNEGASFRRESNSELLGNGEPDSDPGQIAPPGQPDPEPSLGTVQEPSSLEKDGSTDVSGPEIDGELVEAWQRILGRLEQELPAIAFHNWIDPLRLAGRSDSTLVVLAPAHALTSVQNRYLPKITAAARAELGAGATVEVTATTEEAA